MRTPCIACVVQRFRLLTTTHDAYTFILHVLGLFPLRSLLNSLLVSMANMWTVLGLDPPEGVPPALAISIAMYGYTEAEARQAIIEGGDGHKADMWIQTMRQAGFFGSSPSRTPSVSIAAQSESCNNRPSTTADHNLLVGSFLWETLLERLRRDENGFKHQIMVLDNCIKNTGGYHLSERHLESLHTKKAGDFIPFEAIEDNCPWNGCKFAAISVMHLISAPNAAAKRDACRSASRSLGGCTLPPNLPYVRWPYSLSDAFQKAAKAISSHCTALFVNVYDVEIMNNPGKKQGWGKRPGTFAHAFVMTIATDGVHLYQAYGPRGYTLLQFMEQHSPNSIEEGSGKTIFPLSLEEGREWVDQFEVFAANLGGKWTVECNQAYLKCFDVDLVEMGCMKLGSQMDVYVSVEETSFHANTNKDNFNLLPRPNNGRYPPCGDGATAKAKKPPKAYTLDGGVPHYYVPVVFKCGNCGKAPSLNQKYSRCSRCHKVHYCSRDCQVTDWKVRHKHVCKHLGGSIN